METHDREMERQENEAIKSAKEIIKKKTKNKIQKVVWNAVKVAVIPMLILMIKIIAISVLICAVVSMFSSILDGDGTTTNKDLESSSSTRIGGVEINSENWKFTKSQIEDFINSYDTTNNELKQKLLEKIDDIYNWQEDYGYSAGVLITIAFEENRIDIDDFLNEMKQKGQEWQKEGYTTISEIAEDYVGDETSSEWANNIENKLKETAIEAEIVETGQEQSIIGGDGYQNVYVSKSR